MNEEAKTRARAEQKYVLLLTDGTVVGTHSGGPLTRDAAWLLERWYLENYPSYNAKAIKITPKPEEAE